MNVERLGVGVVSVVAGLIVAFVLVPSGNPAVPEGSYVLVEGTIDGVVVNPGLSLEVDSVGGVSGQTGGNTFYPDGFMTMAGRIPPLPYREGNLIATAHGDFVVDGERLIFESHWGRLVYQRK